ncbi:DUF6499 domain-containing protein [Mesorhizobium sp. M0174]|uniref:transcriptional regulator domain-containing protein n=1 Tax=unclassified Mesorhizobium TaxID=325217 RepID=UPI00333A2ED8
MKPNTSRWRDNNSYDFFDSLPIEGLAWECLRRSDAYHRAYLGLVHSRTEREPFPAEAQKRWGLRFPGTARPFGPGARRLVVASGGSRGVGSHVITRLPADRPRDAQRSRKAS